MLRALLTTTTVLLSLSSCGTTVSDIQTCDVVPGNHGAVCDWFLTSNPETLTEDQWTARQALWNVQGDAVSCTRSSSQGAVKKEIEDLCSNMPWYARCGYQAKKKLADGFQRMDDLSARALSMAAQVP